MNEQELRDCPFCGSPANVTWDWYRKKCEVICHGCGARSAPAVYGKGKIPVGGIKCKNDSEARATVVKLWNMRTTEEH